MCINFLILHYNTTVSIKSMIQLCRKLWFTFISTWNASLQKTGWACFNVLEVLQLKYLQCNALKEHWHKIKSLCKVHVNASKCIYREEEDCGPGMEWKGETLKSSQRLSCDSHFLWRINPVVIIHRGGCRSTLLHPRLQIQGTMTTRNIQSAHRLSQHI